MSVKTRPPAPINEHNVFQVSELLTTLKHAVEMNFPPLWVEGEISNFVAARSGHWYFTLKDARGQLRCAFFRNQNLRHQTPKDGQRLRIHGRPSIYTGRGELQLIVDDMQDAGAGDLHRAFEQLKQQLAKEGLFDPERKKTVPTQPRCIGVLTSPVGAALHDVLSTLRRRNPLARVILYPGPVQGDTAAQQIIQALHTAQRRDECDVLLLTRGGGSLEDLQAFNDEALARAFAACRLPTVCAVGHEVDFSICDFIADERAATPTAAAERLSVDHRHWLERIQKNRQQSERILRRLCQVANQQANSLTQRLQAASPRRQWQDQQQRLDDWQFRLQQQMRRQLQGHAQHLRHVQAPLDARRLRQRFSQAGEGRKNLDERLRRIMQQRQTAEQGRLDQLQARLRDLGPKNVLERGYSIVWHGGEIVRQGPLPEGTPLQIQLAHDRIYSKVTRSD